MATSQMELLDALAIVHVERHDSHEAAKVVLRAAAKRLGTGSSTKLDLVACSRLLWRLTWDFRSSGAELSAELPRLTKLLEANGTSVSHEAQAHFAKALWIFDKHGSKKKTLAERHLADAARKDPGYADVRHWVSLGVASERAADELAAGKGAPLFYLALGEFVRASRDYAACPWLSRHIRDPKLWAWLKRRKAVPRRPSTFMDQLEGKLGEVDLAEVAKNAPQTFRHLHSWKYWPCGRREVMAALSLLAPTAELPLDVAFEHMATLGDVDGMTYLWARGVDGRVVRRAAKRAALHGRVDALVCLDALGMSKADKGVALRLVCRERDTSEGGHQGREQERAVQERKDGAVIDALIDMGAEVNLDKAIALALSAWRPDAIRSLLGHGADPEKLRALVREGDVSVRRFYERHFADDLAE